ncbi:MAG: N-acylglucosamine 2-epimerase [Mongoliibacter sp.]|uniref:AGE family epimerase/isomerase n=1 Tax=Mongoliibacter sp. TaxID=2022438 RepID=UPI0012EF649E|nr:AGE family epimerase/isomerase [Mongoliibacter sp.]TVP51699.1 MAG: N-acylglucosamine 2-epimerase [Mongoliibacter sp.]
MKFYLKYSFLLFLLCTCGRPDILDQDLYGHELTARSLEKSMEDNLLATWYPISFDFDSGGYFSNFDYQFNLIEGSHDKFIVTQARHLWSSAVAMQVYPEVEYYSKGAKLGFEFLKNHMWDPLNGGFFQMVNRSGRPLLENESMKTAYGNSFGIYALATYFEVSGDSAALDLAIQAFQWLDENSYDPVHGGYFQHLSQSGEPINRKDDTPSGSDLGYKDQNSSIHLLEAFTALYKVWDDFILEKRLEEMLLLVRDTITHEDGYLILFFKPDWTPVSFQQESRETILNHRQLDHVSYGHDVETAFLMMESAHALGWGDDEITLNQGKKMIDHALTYGWDDENGGFYDEGYYFKGENEPEVIKDSKNWWAQAEGMNALLMMANYYPDDEMDYLGKFQQQWEYIQNYLIDHVHGDWYPGGLDKQPEMKTADKGHIWKGNYHQLRSFKHSIEMLRNMDVGKD